jgi:hypothetical protein
MDARLVRTARRDRVVLREGSGFMVCLGGIASLVVTASAVVNFSV